MANKIVLPCIVIVDNHNTNDPRPHGQIAALYPANYNDLFGDADLDMMLELFKAGSGQYYDYLLTEVDRERIIYRDDFMGIPFMYHPDYYKEK